MSMWGDDDDPGGYDDLDDPYLTRPVGASDPAARAPRASGASRRPLPPLLLALACLLLATSALAVLARARGGIASPTAVADTLTATATLPPTIYLAPVVGPGPGGTPAPLPSPSVGARPPAGPDPAGVVPRVAGQLLFVDVAQQWLYAYRDGALVYRTPVTTGMPQLPTPAGTSRVRAKLRDVTFSSPWPVGSPYYSPPEYVAYALAFGEGGRARYLRDAAGRHCFGPGTELPHTCPDGATETGSRGGVDLPAGAAAWLYAWTRVGAVVDIADVPPPLAAPTATDVPPTVAPPADTPTDVSPTDTPADPTDTPAD